MKIENKKEEFIYWMKKSEMAKENNDEEYYNECLVKAKDILEKIEKDNKSRS